MIANFTIGINESASPSTADRFIATAKTPLRLNPGHRPFDRKRQRPCKNSRPGVHGRDNAMRPEVAFQPCIAETSGPVPRIWITRLRL
jgi:hypothetical protein